MSQYTKYYLYKKQQRISGSSDAWVDVVPTTYSYNADGTMTPVVAEEQSADCGYVPPIEPIYEWRNISITQDYICDDCPIDYSKQYLTFVATESGTFKFSGSTTANTVQYSVDNGNTWADLARNTNSPTVSASGKIMWRATGLTPLEAIGIGRFSSSSSFIVEGNPMSLLYGDNFQNQTSLSGKNYAFRGLFSGCTKVASAENLSLPATTLAVRCYSQMFYKCTSLTTAPELPATTLAQECYAEMFVDCTSLTKAPELKATTLAQECYGWMFQGCTSLTTAPELLATTLANGCYGYMFSGCTALTTPPSVLPATIASRYCYYNMFVNCRNITKSPDVMLTSSADRACTYMFYGCSKLSYIKAMFLSEPSESSAYGRWTQGWVGGVASEGIFVKNSAATWNVRGASGIPTNWTVQLSD